MDGNEMEGSELEDSPGNQLRLRERRIGTLSSSPIRVVYDDSNNINLSEKARSNNVELAYKNYNQSLDVKAAKSIISKKQRKELTAKNKKMNKENRKKNKLHDLKQELVMDDHIVDLDVLVTRLSTDVVVGLTAAEAKSRLLRDGLNVLTPPKETPKIVKLLKQLFGGFAALLWMGAILCLSVFIVEKYVNMKEDLDQVYLAIVLLLVVIVSGLFSYFQEAKGSKIMESFKNMIPPEAVVVRDGQARDVLAEELVIGDIVMLKGGDGVPADIRIIESYGLKVDNSALTGEPDPLLRSSECTDENPLETKNLAFFSTNAVEGQGKGIVIAVGDNTVMGRIASLVTGVQNELTPMKREINSFICFITIFAFTAGFILSTIYGIMSEDVVETVVFFIGIIVANVPEGLLPTVTVCLTITAKKMAKKKCLVKNLEAVETLGSTSVICSDKTGTLTQNRMTVSHLWCDDTISEADISTGQEESQKLLKVQSYQRLMRCVTLCNRAAFKPDQENVPILERKTIADASESALFKYTEIVYGNCTEYRAENTKVCEIPFNSTNKFQLSIHVKKQAISHGKPGDLLLCMKGAPEQIMDRCSTIYADGKEQPINDDWKEKFSVAYAKLGGMGERVLGFADLNLDPGKFNKDSEFLTEPKPNFPITGLRFLGMVTLIDPPRPSVPMAVKKCQHAGVRIIMVTGDHPITAGAIARSVGIIRPGSETIDEISERTGIPIREVDPKLCKAAVIHGQDLKELSEAQLDILLTTHSDIVFARTSPQQKLIIVEGCQRLGFIVAVTGDGVNDSPALKKADIGVAMGITGTDVSKQAADMILLNDNFSSIVTGIEEGRVIFDNIKKTIAYVLTSNIPEMLPFIIYVMIQCPLPLGTITILFIDLGTDIIPCIAMAYESGEADVMSRQPRNPKKDRLVTREMFYVSYGMTGFIESAAGLIAWSIVMALNGWWIQDLFYVQKEWEDHGESAFVDSYGQEWTYEQRQDMKYQGQTIFFLSIVICQIANSIQGRTIIVSMFKHKCNNKVLFIAIASEVIVAIVLTYTPYLNSGLKFRVVNPLWILIGLPFAFLLMFFQELRKYLIRTKPNSWFGRNMKF